VNTTAQRDSIARLDVLCPTVAVENVDEVVAAKLRRRLDNDAEMARIACCLTPRSLGPVARSGRGDRGQSDGR
jgi:hypothetical protein